MQCESENVIENPNVKLRDKVTMSSDFRNEQKFIYVLPTHPLFRQ